MQTTWRPSDKHLLSDARALDGASRDELSLASWIYSLVNVINSFGVYLIYFTHDVGPRWFVEENLLVGSTKGSIKHSHFRSHHEKHPLLFLAINYGIF